MKTNDMGQVLERATPRPWSNEWPLTRSQSTIEANAELIITAVNSFESQRDLLHLCVDALEAVLNFNSGAYPGEVEVALAKVREAGLGRGRKK